MGYPQLLYVFYASTVATLAVDPNVVSTNARQGGSLVRNNRLQRHLHSG